MCRLGGSSPQVRFEHRGLRVVFALHVVTSTWSRVTSTISRRIWASKKWVGVAGSFEVVGVEKFRLMKCKLTLKRCQVCVFSVCDLLF